MSDVPTGLEFVDPDETDATYRVCLFAASGAGKTVAATSAPTPILALSADRPSAYLFARKHHGLSAHDLREVRYRDPSTLQAVYNYLDSDEGKDIRTLIVDPISNIVDDIRQRAPKRSDGDTDYEWVNRQVLNFVKGLRRFDVNLVLVAYEKLNDGNKGDGGIYPAIGGMTLINKTMGELDICAHIDRIVRDAEEEGAEPEELWIGQLQPAGNLKCKEATGQLGPRRVAHLARWFEVATEGLAPKVADESDLPFAETFEPEDGADEDDPGAPTELPLATEEKAA